MKREERSTLNHIRKTVDAGTICVEIPEGWTHEGRQAIHDLLTVEKHMRAVCIGWNADRNTYAIRYTPATTPDAIADRMKQEGEDIDTITAALRRTEYTWNGYKKPAATTPDPDTDTTTTDNERRAETMKTTTKPASKATRKPAARKATEPRAPFIDKVKQALADAKARLDAGEEIHVHFSEGNSKTHMPSLDLLPLVTCHGRCRELCGKTPEGKYLPPCYAARIANRLPDALRNYAENTALAIYRPGQYWQEVNDKMKTCRFMRLFVSGDMIIKGYFENLCKALENNPHVEMQGFSKCYEIVNRYIDTHGALPKNLHLLLSGWYEQQAINPHNLPESRVYEDTLPEGWLSCGGNCANCACIGLGCWKANNGDIVGLKKH